MNVRKEPDHSTSILRQVGEGAPTSFCPNTKASIGGLSAEVIEEVKVTCRFGAVTPKTLSKEFCIFHSIVTSCWSHITIVCNVSRIELCHFFIYFC